MREYSLPRALSYGALIHAITLPIILFISAAVCYATPDPIAYLPAFSLGGLVISSAVSGIVTARAPFGRGMLVPLSSAIACALVILTISLIVSGGAPGAAILNALSYVGASALSACVGGRQKKRARKTRRARKY